MSSNLGDKVRGAAHVIHGVGDNIRGTALGAADTVTNSREGEAKNDVLATGGREETARGMSMFKGGAADSGQGGGTAVGSDYSTTTTTTTSDPPSHDPFRSHDQQVGFGSDGAAPTYQENPNFGRNVAGFGSSPGELTGETVAGGHPQHHRDDAVSNDPDAVSTGRRHLSHPMQRVDRTE
ncbi:hypothetical protein K435DRAFT_960226 [Dendrothele bispora CBS 962.96]|uniref:Uncharacterized protein n=1 Tax=Dendrothele bispora (strain CBS 962.96) TaxID=1314807 RepID=A0A4S8MUV2_DENBC|nr:hypothetical protein K435DRAFT_960226 [Dendrothele bispora CBS 962.96]